MDEVNYNTAPNNAPSGSYFTNFINWHKDNSIEGKIEWSQINTQKAK